MIFILQKKHQTIALMSSNYSVEKHSSQKTDDETAKKTAIDPTIDDCTVYCFFMYYWSDIFMQKIIFFADGKEYGTGDWTD